MHPSFLHTGSTGVDPDAGHVDWKIGKKKLAPVSYLTEGFRNLISETPIKMCPVSSNLFHLVI